MLELTSLLLSKEAVETRLHFQDLETSTLGF